MKPIVLSCLIAASLGVPMLACEGEPPMTPADLPPPAASETVVVAEEPSAPTPAPTAPAPTASAPPVAAGSASGSASAAPTPPPPATAGAIVGTVAATPASMSQWAVVWLEDGPPVTVPDKAIGIDNNHMTFSPFVQVVPVGGKVVFSNSDPFPHNVFSPDNERFNLGNIAQHAGAVRVFKQPAQYALLCNLHPGMLGYLVVTPSPWFAKAHKGGAFAIKDVPAGTYKVTAWAPRNPPVTQTVTVKGGGDATVNFELHRQ